MSDRSMIGPHQVEREGDILVVHWLGKATLQSVIQVYERIEQLIADQGYALVLYDMRRAEQPDSATRQWVGRWAHKQESGTLAVAAYGMSTPLRAMMLLVYHAIEIFQGTQPTRRRLFGEEAPARSWLAVQRAQLSRTRQVPSAPST